MEKFNTHGGYFAPQGYQKVTTGGSHEENPYGGIQMGVDPEGVPNLLEEGEPVYNDFVYSDNIKADAEMLKKYNLPIKYAGEPYSDVVNHFMDEAEERPGDAISNNGLRVMLGRLAQAQEEQKAIKEREALEEELANLSPEELAELEEILAAESQPSLEETPAVEQPVIEDAGQQPQLMSNGGFIKVFGDGSPGDVVAAGALSRVAQAEADYAAMLEKEKEASEAIRSANYKKKLEKDIKRIGRHVQRDEKKLKSIEEKFSNPFMHKSNLPSMLELLKKQAGLVDYNTARLGNVKKEYEKLYGPYVEPVKEVSTAPIVDDKLNFDDEPTAVVSVPETSSPSAIDWDNLTHTYTKALGGKINKSDKGDDTVNVFRTGEYIRRAVPIMDPSLVVLPAGEIDWDSYYTPVEEEVVNDAAEIPAHFVDLDAYRVPVADEVVEDEPLPGEQVSAERAAALPLLSTLPRYSGAFTSGLLGLYDMAQKPDRYRLPNYSPVLPSSRTAFVNPVYTPTDENIALNAVRSSGNTTINALRNSGLGPSTAASLLAANNAIGKNIGSALTQVRESNDKERNAVIDRINANNQAASSLRFRTGMARAQIQNDAMLRNLQNNLTLQRLNNQAEGEKYAAISNQLDQTGQALSGIGRENMNLNMINSNPAYQYVILPNGEIGYLPTRSKGGTLLKKYKK